jgi:hypothetical protein
LAKSKAAFHHAGGFIDPWLPGACQMIMVVPSNFVNEKPVKCS